MHRIVFFGLDGGFSTMPLSMLANTDLKPVLVVKGLERSESKLRPTHHFLPADPGWLDRMRGRVHEASRAGLDHPLVDVAHQFGIDVLETSNANDARAFSIIERAKPDLFVIAGFPHLLRSRLLAVPTYGGLNVHPGRLPEERGPAPLFWALKNGSTSIGFTIHVLDKGEDTGDVVASGEIELEPGTHGMVVLKMCAQAAIPLLLKAIRSVLRGDAVRIPQKKEGAGRCPSPKFRDGMVDANRPAVEVYTFVKGCAGRYSLFVECGGDRFFVADATSFDPKGKMDFEYALTGDVLILRCNPGVIELQIKDALFTAEYSEGPLVVDSVRSPMAASGPDGGHE